MEMRREFNHVWLFAGKKAKSLICSVSSDLLNGVRITGSMRGRWISYCSLSLLNGWNRFNAARGQATAGPPNPCTWQGAPEKLVASSRFRGGGGGWAASTQHPAPPLSLAPPTTQRLMRRAGAGLEFKIKGQIKEDSSPSPQCNWFLFAK